MDLTQTPVLLQWCRDYQRQCLARGEKAGVPAVRFLIAQYQIHQARDARRSAWAAFAMNLLCAAEGAKFATDSHLPVRLAELTALPRLHLDDAEVLRHLAFLAQQFAYLHTCRPGMARYDRVDREAAARSVARLVVVGLGQLDPAERREFLEEERQRLEASEWRSA